MIKQKGISRGVSAKKHTGRRVDTKLNNTGQINTMTDLDELCERAAIMVEHLPDDDAQKEYLRILNELLKAERRKNEKRLRITSSGVD